MRSTFTPILRLIQQQALGPFTKLIGIICLLAAFQTSADAQITASINGPDSVCIQPGSHVLLTANVQGGTGGYTFAWANPGSGFTVTGPSVSIPHQLPGIFRIILFVRDSSSTTPPAQASIDILFYNCSGPIPGFRVLSNSPCAGDVTLFWGIGIHNNLAALGATFAAYSLSRQQKIGWYKSMLFFIISI